MRSCIFSIRVFCPRDVRDRHLSVKEPFKGLFTQGMVVHETYRNAAGWVQPADVLIEGEGAGRTAKLLSDGSQVEIGAIEKMSKSKKNTIDPDDIIAPMVRIRRAGSCCRIRRRSAM